VIGPLPVNLNHGMPKNNEPIDAGLTASLDET